MVAPDHSVSVDTSVAQLRPRRAAEPFVDGSGRLYVPAKAGTGLDPVHFYVSTDNGASWVKQFSTPSFTGNNISAWSTYYDAANEEIHVLVIQAVFGMQYDFVSTYCKMGSMDHPTDPQTAIISPTGTGISRSGGLSAPVSCGIVCRSDGVLLMTHRGNEESIMGTAYQRVEFFRSDNDGSSWSSVGTFPVAGQEFSQGRPEMQFTESTQRARFLWAGDGVPDRIGRVRSYVNSAAEGNGQNLENTLGNSGWALASNGTDYWTVWARHTDKTIQWDTRPESSHGSMFAETSTMGTTGDFVDVTYYKNKWWVFASDATNNSIKWATYDGTWSAVESDTSPAFVSTIDEVSVGGNSQILIAAIAYGDPGGLQVLTWTPLTASGTATATATATMAITLHNISASVTGTASVGVVAGETLASYPWISTSLKGLTWDGVNWRASDFGTDLIYRLDSSFGVISSFAAPAGPTALHGMTFDGTNLWVVGNNNTIYEVNPSTGGVVSSFAGPNTAAWGITWDGTDLWIGDTSSGLIYRVNTAGSTLGNIAPPAEVSSLGAICWDGSYLWAGYLNDTLPIRQLDPSDGSVLHSIDPVSRTPLDAEFRDGWLWTTADDVSDDAFIKIAPFTVDVALVVTSFISASASATATATATLTGNATFVLDPISVTALATATAAIDITGKAISASATAFATIAMSMYVTKPFAGTASANAVQSSTALVDRIIGTISVNGTSTATAAAYADRVLTFDAATAAATASAAAYVLKFITVSAAANATASATMLSNAPPNTPTIITPTGGSTVATPVDFEITYSDPDLDPQARISIRREIIV